MYRMIFYPVTDLEDVPIDLIFSLYSPKNDLSAKSGKITLRAWQQIH